jgi:hypothetical protein
MYNMSTMVPLQALCCGCRIDVREADRIDAVQSNLSVAGVSARWSGSLAASSRRMDQFLSDLAHAPLNYST